MLRDPHARHGAWRSVPAGTGCGVPSGGHVGERSTRCEGHPRQSCGGAALTIPSTGAVAAPDGVECPAGIWARQRYRSAQSLPYSVAIRASIHGPGELPKTGKRLAFRCRGTSQVPRAFRGRGERLALTQVREALEPGVDCLLVSVVRTSQLPPTSDDATASMLALHAKHRFFTHVVPARVRVLS